MAAALLAVAGCAANIPADVTRQVTYEGEIQTLQQSPDQYTDEFVIFGGKILETKNLKDTSELLVLQFPLDDNHRPQMDKASGGRFLVRAKDFLDPAIYSPGTWITVAGTVVGAETRSIGAYDYTHPVIKGRTWTWDPDRGGFPRIHFGIGVGTTF